MFRGQAAGAAIGNVADGHSRYRRHSRDRGTGGRPHRRDSVLAVYRGRVQVQPHKYTGPEGHYLVVTHPRDTLFLIIFETDGRHVTRFRAGRKPAVQYVEGCA